MAAREQLIGHFDMAGFAGRLIDRRLIGVEAEPRQSFEDHLGGFGGAALAVGVFDPQQIFAAVVAGEQIIEQRGAGAANVQQAGGAGSEAGADHDGLFGTINRVGGV